MSVHTQAIEQHTRPNGTPTGSYRPRSILMITAIQLINEALSRARMPKPQDTPSEALRPARLIAIAARREQTLRMGSLIF